MTAGASSRKATASATSSGVGRRASRIAPPFSRFAASAGARTGPGATALTRRAAPKRRAAARIDAPSARLDAS